MKEIRVLLEAYNVGRYHTAHLTRPQSIAEHQWGAAMIGWTVVCWWNLGRGDEFHQCRAFKVVGALLVHDLPELVSGDIPAFAKCLDRGASQKLDAKAEEGLDGLDGLDGSRGLGAWPWVELGTLSPREADIVKVADILELVMYLCTELERGNRSILYIVENGLAMLKPFLERHGFGDEGCPVRECYDYVLRVANNTPLSGSLTTNPLRRLRTNLIEDSLAGGKEGAS